MKKFVFAAALPLALLGCSRSSEKVTRNLEFVLTPDAAAHSVTLECSASSTGKCYVNFAGAGSPSRGEIPAGNTITFSDLAAGTQYCVETTSDALSRCTPAPLPEKRVTVRRKVSTDTGA